MVSQELIEDVRKAWLQSNQRVFTVLVPSLGLGECLPQFFLGLPAKPKSTLRVLALTDAKAFNRSDLLPHVELTPGWNYLPLADLKAELLIWSGAQKTGLQEVCGKVDAVLTDEPPYTYRKRLRTGGASSTDDRQTGSVAVIGAGIAGSAVALALCQRGWRVDLYDTAHGPAEGASGNWLGAFHAHITRGDSPLSRLTRLGYAHTVFALQQLTESGLLKLGEDWALPGHLQTVPPGEAAYTRDTLAQLGFPESLVRWVEPNALLPSPLGGLYFPGGGWVKPPRWVQANLQACGPLLTTHYNARVDNLQTLLGQHDNVVLCCAEQSLALAPITGAKVGVVKGQISKLRSVAKPGVVLSGESYAIAPPAEDWMVLGASYERPATDLRPTEQADQQNIARFRAAFPQWPLGELLDHRCALRFVWHDRLPSIGPVPNLPGVYMSTGFASRGLLWAALGGWLVADHLTGQPLGLKLLDKIAPRGAA